MRTVDVGVGPLFLAVAYGAAWTLNQVDGTITRVDARTGRTKAIIADLAGGGGDIAAGGRWVWARSTAVLLSRIDPRTNKVVERFAPAVGSGGVAVGYGAVWIAAHDVDTVWRLPIPPRQRPTRSGLERITDVLPDADAPFAVVSGGQLAKQL